MKGKQVDGGMFSGTTICRQLGTTGAVFFGTVAITADAVTKFQILLLWTSRLVVIYQHAGILNSHGKIRFVTTNVILHRTGYIPVVVVQQICIVEQRMVAFPGQYFLFNCHESAKVRHFRGIKAFNGRERASPKGGINGLKLGKNRGFFSP
jgi:hypothetical protein